MKKPAYTLVLCLLLALLTMLRSYAAAADALPHITPADTTTLDVPCAAAILIDEDSGTVLYEKNADQQRPIASITKVMTLLLTFEALSAGRIALTDTVPVSEHAYHMGGSQIWLEPGEQMTLDDMLKAICISSANDAAVAVAEFVDGSEPAFVQQMNARAAELGLTNTHFENACGLDAEGHLSTARDVAMMSREILLHHAEVRNYCSIWMDSLRGGATQLVNTNKMLKTYNGITGLKTGTTSKAGVCISASAERDGLRLIAVVLGSPSGKERFQAATALLDYGFANYENVTPQLPENAPETISVSHGTADEVELSYSTPTRFLMPKNAAEPLTATLELPEKLSAPVEADTLLGTVQLASGGEVLARFPITAAQGVDALSFRYCFGRLVDSLLLYEGDFVQNK